MAFAGPRLLKDAVTRWRPATDFGRRGCQWVREMSSSTGGGGSVDFTHAVLGGGITGLAVARQLARREGTNVVLIEKGEKCGGETSSRNSEVIHAGLYYPPHSLKTRLCIRGSQLLYSFCNTHSVPHKQTGKLIVAQTPSEHDALERLHAHATALSVPTQLLPPGTNHDAAPGIQARAGALWSPRTGIVDSHTLMSVLEGQFLDAGGTEALQTAVTGVTHDQREGIYTIHTRSSESEPDSSESFPITARSIINALGLLAAPLANTLLPVSQHLKPAYSRGTYYTYTPSDTSPPMPKIETLVYPAPDPTRVGLGTHLTIDLAGQIRFGPDAEALPSLPVLDDRRQDAGKTVDVDVDYTIPSSPGKLAAAGEAIQQYLPALDHAGLRADYCGIRPRIDRQSDFLIREETERGLKGWVNCLGMESPGLTSGMAVAEEVERVLFEDGV